MIVVILCLYGSPQPRSMLFSIAPLLVSPTISGKRKGCGSLKEILHIVEGNGGWKEAIASAVKLCRVVVVVVKWGTTKSFFTLGVSPSQ